MKLKPSDEENITKKPVKEQYGISFGDSGNNLDSLNKQPDANVSDRTYEENIIFLLNEEFVQVLITLFHLFLSNFRFGCCNF